MKKLWITAIFAVLSLIGCSSTASLIRTDTAGGRVRLEGAYMGAMGQARMVMVEHCRGRFAFLELGDAVEFQCNAARSAELALSTELASYVAAAAPSEHR